MTPEQYLDALMSLPGLFAARVSWDGRWVAWSWHRVHPAIEVYVAPTDGSSAPLRLTDGDQDSILESWLPDSSGVIISQDTDGDERGVLYRVDLAAPGKLIQLTESAPNYFIRGGDLHPNGRYLVYGANLDLESGAEIEITQMLRHDLQTGERHVLASPKKGAYVWPELSPDGQWVLYSRADLAPGGRQIWLVDIEGNHDHEIASFGPSAKTFASWFPDSRRVLILADSATHRRVGVLPVDGDGDLRWLIDDPARSIESAYVPHGSDHIVVIETQGARPRASLLNPESGAETTLPDIGMNLIPLRQLEGDVWLGQVYSSTQPRDLVRFNILNPDPSGFQSVARVWDRVSLKPEDFARAEDYRWKSVDGLEIQGWLYRPRGEARGTVLYVHGGPTAHSEDSINTQIQYFVHLGFNVLDPNYRGSTGFSLEYREKIKEDGWGGREQDDIRTGIESLIAAGIASPGKVGMTGTSYGGYSSWCGITRFPVETLAASAPICGMTDLVVDYNTTRPDLRPYSEEMLGGKPDDLPEKYHERSPINFVHNIKGRLLIVQGLRDPNVTPDNVEVVARALQSNHVEYSLLAFDDEGHGIAKPKNQRRLNQELGQFFADAFA